MFDGDGVSGKQVGFIACPFDVIVVEHTAVRDHGPARYTAGTMFSVAELGLLL
jgi:hypothetical protein